MNKRNIINYNILGCILEQLNTVLSNITQNLLQIVFIYYNQVCFKYVGDSKIILAMVMSTDLQSSSSSFWQ